MFRAPLGSRCLEFRLHIVSLLSSTLTPVLNPKLPAHCPVLSLTALSSFLHSALAGGKNACAALGGYCSARSC